jgi:hypothetical protein
VLSLLVLSLHGTGLYIVLLTGSFEWFLLLAEFVVCCGTSAHWGRSLRVCLLNRCRCQLSMILNSLAVLRVGSQTKASGPFS